MKRPRFRTIARPVGAGLASGLMSEALDRIVFDGHGGARVVARYPLGFRVRDVAAVPDGALWVIADDDPGGLHRLTPRRGRFDRIGHWRYRAGMIALLSPAKTLDFERTLPSLELSTPHFAAEARTLARSAANLTQKRLAELMHISPRLARLNATRFRGFADLPERPALFAFAGDVYVGFAADTLDEAGIAFAQDHVRMLSGLYGLLRPLDEIRPYRLEMGTPWAPRHKRLTDWWGDRIAALLREQSAREGSGVVLNLASVEYFAAVAGRLPGVRVIDVEFREPGPDGPRFVSFAAKRARGMMARWLCEHRIGDVDAMRGFDSHGYRFDAAESEADRWRFVRG